QERHADRNALRKAQARRAGRRGMARNRQRSDGKGSGMNRIASLAAAAITVAAVAAHAASPRVVSVGGSTTEIVYALGAGDALVGVDSTSLYPAEADALPDIGYVRQLSAEGLLSLNPDLILAGSEAGPAAALEQSASAGVEIVK